MNIETVMEYDGGDTPTCFLARGHVDKAEFVLAVKRECETDVSIDKVAHGYMRNVPTGIKGEWTLQDAVKGRGAFAVTFVDLL